MNGPTDNSTEQYFTLPRASNLNRGRKAIQFPKCDLCGRDVELNQGTLSISLRKIREMQEQMAKWEKAHPGPILTAGEILASPPRVRWIWHHASCNVEDSYWIDAERFDTHEKALHWTIHLMDKAWFQFTDWRDVIERFFPECS